MRVYISGPMDGIEDYQDRFQEAEDRLRKEGHIPFNPAYMDVVMPPECTRDDFLYIDLCLLNMCDAIYLMDGWENSKGANREYGYALAKGMTVMRE